MSAVRRTVRVITITLGRLYQDDGWAMASHLTLSALMALFPFLIFVGSVAAFIGQQPLADQAAELIFQTWPEDVAAPIAREVSRVLANPHTGVLTISILVTIWLASNGVEAIRAALTRAYGSEQARSFLFLRLQSFGFVFIGTLAMLALAFLGVLGPLIWTMLQRWWPNLTDFNQSFQIFRYLIVGSLLLAALFAAHLWLPGRRWKGLRIWPGILATLGGWWLATSAFATYLERFANYVTTYAGLASIVTALFYLYVMSLILIFGAELNAAIARTSPRASRRKDETPAPPPSLPPANDD
ncbi:MAG: YihY/virulence factor BrkB family protein [Bauldia sp.]|nr:YihY/virulence factor BrkB family protein [Bauldia sp.]